MFLKFDFWSWPLPFSCFQGSGLHLGYFVRKCRPVFPILRPCIYKSEHRGISNRKWISRQYWYASIEQNSLRLIFSHCIVNYLRPCSRSFGRFSRRPRRKCKKTKLFVRHAKIFFHIRCSFVRICRISYFNFELNCVQYSSLSKLLCFKIVLVLFLIANLKLSASFLEK